MLAYIKRLFNLRRNIPILIVIYVISVFGFSIYYYNQWSVDSSNFIVMREYNERTLSIRELKPIYEIESYNVSSLEIPFSQKEFNILITPLFIKLENFEDNYKELEVSESTRKKALKAISEGKGIDESDSETYINKKTEPFQKKINILKKKKTDLEMKTYDRFSRINEVNDLLKIKELQIEIIRTQVDEKRATLEAMSHILANPEKYLDSYIYSDQKKISEEQLKVGTDILTVQNDIAKMMKIFHEERQNKVKYMDFLYFSLSISTASGQGDIIPNDSRIRFISGFQVVLSLILFGFILNSMTMPRGTKKAN